MERLRERVGQIGFDAYCTMVTARSSLLNDIQMTSSCGDSPKRPPTAGCAAACLVIDHK